jgi:peptidoglycan/LPS O-acetylase OafA/YrhL
MPELDSLRGVAILMVLFYHGFASRYGTEGLYELPRFVAELTGPGWAGVNLFFALSGFLITGILLESKPRPDYYGRFYSRRALRILPAYYGLLLLLAVFGRYALIGESISWKFLGLSAVYLANITVLLSVPMQFGVLWSLAVEEHFYLLWPVVVRRLRSRSIALFALLIAASAAGARIITFRLGYDCFAHYTWLVADGLAFGSFLAILIRTPFGTRTGLKLASLIAVLASVALILVDRPFHHPLFGGALHITALNLVCTATVAITLLLGTGSWRFLIDRRILRFFGDISYGLYLIHMMVFNVFDNLQRWLLPVTPIFKGHFEIMLIRFLVAGSAAVGLAVLSRRYLEEPFLRLKDRLPMSGSSAPVEESAMDARPPEAQSA